MKAVVIPEKKMQSYIKYCKNTSCNVMCDCGKCVKVNVVPYFYDEDENDIYFASVCPNCGDLIITKE